MTARAGYVPVIAVLLFFMLLDLVLVAQSENGSRVIPVFANIVEAGTINRKIETSADVLPLLGVDVHPDTVGRIVEIFVDVGLVVKKGQELAQINNDVQKAQFEQAKAAVTVAKAAVEMQKVMFESAQSSLVSSKSVLESANVQVKNLAQTRARFEKLLSEGAVSRQQLDDLVAQHDSANARLIGATADVSRANDAILSAKMTIEVRRAELLQAEANLNAVRVALDNTMVRAPFDGVIVSRRSDPGAMANPAASLFRIEQNDPVKIIASVIERDIDQMKVGKTRVLVQLDSIDQIYEGVVDLVHPSIDSVSRTGRVEILLKNPDNRLRTGMFAKLSFLLNTSSDVPIVARDSLVRHNGQHFAYVIENGCAIKRLVKIGIIDEARVEIVSGLKPGEQIISRGLEFVREGSPVKVVESESGK
ncbi:MAG: efflux RND transporter periplasmic adaptor subunit [Candidatus Riflebacteria bacterium]|nr:efflux RND transporter periplasmic adaptor subunit [Candidatus Riflebacteria bacterium]